MRQLDFDRAFAATPECIHESILTAFEKGEKAMKFRHKLTSALTAAALLIVFGVTALGLNGLEQPVDDAVAPLSSALSTQAQNSSNVVSIGGRDLPENTEIYVNVDPNAFVPWFYSTDEVVFTKLDGAYLHMDFNCARMEAGSVLDVPLLGSINELGLQLCPECFTLGGIPVHHDGETACLPYHNASGQESTLAEAVSGGLKLCSRCFIEVYTAPGNLYMHCKAECTAEQIKKFIHSASAAGLDACPDCMPPSVNPDTGIAAPVIYSIPMPTPAPEDFIAQNPDWPVAQTYPSPTPAPVATPTPVPAAVSMTIGNTGEILSLASFPAEDSRSAYVTAESTPEPTVLSTVLPTPPPEGVDEMPVNSTPTPPPVEAESTPEPTVLSTVLPVAVDPTPEPKDSDIYPPAVLAATHVFYSASDDDRIHVTAACGGESPVSLLGALREGKSICTDCTGRVYVLIDTRYNGVPTGGETYSTVPMTMEYFHANDGCSIAEGGYLLRVAVPEALERKYSPCPNCFYDVYMENETYHLRSDCALGTVTQSYFAYAVAYDYLACPICVQSPFMIAYHEISSVIRQEANATEETGSGGNNVQLSELAAALGSIADQDVTLYTDPGLADCVYHSRISCQYMQNPAKVSYADMFQNPYSICGWCLNLENKLVDKIEYAYLPEVPMALAGIESLQEAVAVIAGE